MVCEDRLRTARARRWRAHLERADMHVTVESLHEHLGIVVRAALDRVRLLLGAPKGRDKLTGSSIVPLVLGNLLPCVVLGIGVALEDVFL